MVRKAECIQKLSENPSKQEEIDFLQAIELSLPENSYLKSFFTPQMVVKMEQNIRNDFCSDFDEIVEQMVNEKLALKREQMEAQYKRDAEEMQKFSKACEERAQKAEAERNSMEREKNEAWEKLDRIHRISSGW